MKRNIKPLTPQCGLCKRLYSYRDDDGSGLCPKCRSANSQPILAAVHQSKQTIMMEVGKQMMDDFEQEELQEQETIQDNLQAVQNVAETQESPPPMENAPSDATTAVAESDELRIEDIIETGRYGVSNSQMIPALKKAIAEQSIEKLILLKQSYTYIYDKSVRYLKKVEREYIVNNLK